MESHRHYIQVHADEDSFVPGYSSINWDIGKFHCPHCDQIIDHVDVRKPCPGKKV